MEKSIFNKTIVGLMLALLASTALAIGIVGAEPLSPPSDEGYLTPTFQGLNVKDGGLDVSGNIRNTASTQPV
ncbi:MAG: hypothetical protein WCX95_03075, partial [Candidatus Gracilibacteria bacterium]